VIALRRCWWCGLAAVVDTELPESGGMVMDTDTSWLCVDGGACGKRAYEQMCTPGYRRNKGAPATQPDSAGAP
jgi:hypothetical protein